MGVEGGEGIGIERKKERWWGAGCVYVEGEGQGISWFYLHLLRAT